MILKDKIVVITGGSKGFGRALAEVFIAEGANVVINSHNREEVENVGREIGALGVLGDVRKEEDMENLAQRCIEEFGHIDIWINNAGLWMAHAFAEEFSMDKVRDMFDVNIVGTINGSRVALRHMKGRNAGTILNVISTSALSGRPEISMYATSKWAVNGFTKSIRDENKDNDISVLSVFPGGMQTTIFGDYKYSNFHDFMNTKDVAKKVIDNLKRQSPESELIIKRPST
jgi:NAD(P)-dependent dehydrogenase (short-subunit alcohol dehydrogenase family)